MLRFTLCLLCGVYAMQQAESLPSAPWLLALAAITTGVLLISRLRLAAAFLLGCLLTAGSGLAVISDRLDSRLEGEVTEFAGTIGDFPVPAGAALRLMVKPQGRFDLPSRIRLSWYEPTDMPRPGEVWLITARLRAPRGLANPHGFDYEGWLHRQRIGATGYVVAATRAPHQPGVGSVTELRHHVLQRIRLLLPEDAARAVLLAITIGARQEISREQWDRYARTGTSHLMAISGLHIGLAAAGLFLLVRIIAAPFACGRNIRDVALIAAAAGATAYTLISGLAVPAQRALLMVLLVAAGLLLRRQKDPRRVLSLACLAVLLADPMAALAPGFQLSFLAVAMLLWSGRQLPTAKPQRTPGPAARGIDAISRLAQIQMVLLFGLLPLTVLHFNRITWLAPLVNFVAVPIFNLCTVPLVLAAIVLDGPMQFAGDALLRLAHASVVFLLWLVDAAAKLPHAEIRTLAMNSQLQLLLWVTALWAALPPGFPGRYLACIATLFVVLQKPPVPPADCVDLHVLDVGQGLSVVAQTHTHVAVFDAGPSFRSGGDTATLVLVPFLRSLGLRQIDTLIVSHSDLDHAGAVPQLLEQMPVARILYGEPPAIGEDPSSLRSRCAAGQSWHWDGIDFRILHPGSAANSTGNNASCVLEISAATQRALITGDIETPVERLLLAQNSLRPSQIVVVPHHGSRTSSSVEFVAALGAELAIVSAGFGNRWGLPKAEVVGRWQGQGAKMLSTATSGAISRRLCVDGRQGPVIEERRAHRRYWHAPP